MNEQKRTITIPSVIINRDFLSRLGDIIERDMRELNRFSWLTISALIRKAQEDLEIRASYLTREEKVQEMERIARQITYNNRPDYQASYQIETERGAKQTFTFMRELGAINPFPDGVRTLTISITHFDKNQISTEMYIHQPTGIFDKAECTISCADTEKLGLAEKYLKDVCLEFITPYYWLFVIKRSPYLLQKVISFFFAGTMAVLLFRMLMPAMYVLPAILINASLFLFLSIALGCYLLLRSAFAFVYPYYLFSLSQEDTTRARIAVAIGAFLLVMIALLLRSVRSLFES